MLILAWLRTLSKCHCLSLLDLGLLLNPKKLLGIRSTKIPTSEFWYVPCPIESLSSYMILRTKCPTQIPQKKGLKERTLNH
jgi:hypothetical protein